MKTVLFVDDEPHILGALKRGMRRMRKEWKLLFASSGDEALEFLNEHSIDVLISDMRMPGMDGATLVKKFHERHPRSLRFGLSGYSESDQLISSSIAFHQFWSKPCTCDTITDKLKTCFKIGDLLPSDVQDKLCALNIIPVSASALEAFRAELSKSELDIDALSKILRSDLGLYCTLGKLFNTNFLGAPRDVNNPSDLLLSVNWLIKMFESKELSMSCPAQPAGYQPSGLVKLAPILAQVDGANSGLQGTTRMTARLSELTSPIQHHLEIDDPQLLAVASAYLVTIWGFPADVAEALLPCSEDNNPIANYIQLARDALHGDDAANTRVQSWCQEHGASLDSCLTGQIEEPVNAH